MFYPWKPSRYISHANLGRGRLLVEWINGRWVPLACTWPNGRQEDGLTALHSRDLTLRCQFHPVPKIIENSR